MGGASLAGGSTCAPAIAALNAVAARDKQQFVATGRSVHGSSTLRADSNPTGREAHLRSVLAFLGRFTSR